MASSLNDPVFQVVSAPEPRRRTVVAEERRVLAAGRTVPSQRVVQRASSAGATVPAPRARDWAEMWGWRLGLYIGKDLRSWGIFKMKDFANV